MERAKTAMIYYAIVWLSGAASGVLLFGWFATWRNAALEAEVQQLQRDLYDAQIEVSFLHATAEDYRHELGL